MPTVLVVNGPNLNLLGKREPEIYGSTTLSDLEAELTGLADKLGLSLKFLQSNSEGEIIDFIQAEAEEVVGMIINPAAYTHYSLAIRDAIAATGIRTIEVHISNIYAREEFRQKSVIAPVCAGHIAGLGFEGYKAALKYFSGGRE